jgi:hypothetical protein
LQNLLVYFCDCKKEKEKLNKCAIATIWRALLQTRSYVCCKKTWLCICACKRYLVVWNMIASLDSVSLQKTKVFDCKICWFISVTAKKKKKNWTSVRLQLFGVRDCKPGVMCVAKKPDFVFVLAKDTWLFGIWLQAWIVCHCKKLKCVIAQPVFFEFNIVDVLASA